MIVMQPAPRVRPRTHSVSAGMDVAHFAAGILVKGDFDHAVDNSGDSVGPLANWLAVERWRQPYPPAPRSGRDRFGHQPGDWSSSSLIRVYLR